MVFPSRRRYLCAPIRGLRNVCKSHACYTSYAIININEGNTGLFFFTSLSYRTKRQSNDAETSDIPAHNSGLIPALEIHSSPTAVRRKKKKKKERRQARFSTRNQKQNKNIVTRHQQTTTLATRLSPFPSLSPSYFACIPFLQLTQKYSEQMRCHDHVSLARRRGVM